MSNTWETQDGYQMPTDIDQDEIKSFFGGGRGKRRTREDQGAGSHKSRGSRDTNADRVQRTDGEDKHVSQPTSKGNAASEDKPRTEFSLATMCD